ncbi:hypothetical protein [Mucilaginibacter pedocola]|uniref:hypothetical protein n=1 Tax=Mucilaginibacter pedocola TaxID=1792845 RepID=UPI0012DEB7D9|nr:hypothetical protein [Mucilaginibacter pedocola]
MNDKIYPCYYCGKPMNYTDRKPRNFYLRKFLPFLPIRPYWCTHCLKTTFFWGKKGE